jgi:hypothetical protein
MTDPTFRAKVRPELHPAAKQLVAIYEATPGSTGPGCCPEALAAVLREIACRICEDVDPVKSLWDMAALLRGEEP